MSIKNISFFSLLVVTIYMSSNAHEAKAPSLECTGKVPKKRPPLFIQAEQNEQLFLDAEIKCLQTNDCAINLAFINARNDVIFSICELVAHLEELEQTKKEGCNLCEKNETNHIKKRLTELLNLPTKKYEQ